MAEYKPDTSEELGHEPLAVSARGVSVAVAVLFGGIIVALILMAGLSVYLAAVRGGAPTVRPVGTAIAPPPGIPAIDANQTATLRQVRAREKTLLTEYAWEDRDTGVARIPIHRAMEILARQPVPTRELPEESSDEGTAIE